DFTGSSARKGVPANEPRNPAAAKQAAKVAQEVARQARLARAQQARQQLEWLWRNQAQWLQLQDKLVREMWPEGADDLKTRLADDQPMIRWIAAQVVAQRRLPLESELIELLTDPSAEVREAARQGLVRLSRGCDFGPARRATTAQCTQAATAWRRWLA